MSRQITYQISNSLQPLADSDWDQFFRGHPDSAGMIKLMELCGLEGFKFHSIVASADDEPILVLPIFETNYSLASTLSGTAKKIVSVLEKALPKILSPHVLGVGFVEGEWGQIGVRAGLPVEMASQALAGALDVLESFAEMRNAQIVAFKDFCPAAYGMLIEGAGDSLAQATSLPFCQMKVEFSDLDDYLNELPRKVRQDLKRKMRQAADVKAVYTKDISPWLDEIYALYVDQVQRSEISFGMHRRRYFAEICQAVPGAQYILFLLDGQLIGFNLIIDQGDRLVDKYVGIAAEQGRSNNVYFLAFLEKVRYCTAHGIKLVHLGAAAEGVKVRLGAYTIPSYVLFRHRNPLLHFALCKLTRFLDYKPAAFAPVIEGASEPPAQASIESKQELTKVPC